MNPNYNKQVSNSDEGEHDASFEQKKDAYLENATSDDSGKETMSFNSGEEEVKMAEKFDSNASASSSSIEGDGDWSEKEDTAAKRSDGQESQWSQEAYGDGGQRPHCLQEAHVCARVAQPS